MPSCLWPCPAERPYHQPPYPGPVPSSFSLASPNHHHPGVTPLAARLVWPNGTFLPTAGPLPGEEQELPKGAHIGPVLAAGLQGHGLPREHQLCAPVRTWPGAGTVLLGCDWGWQCQGTRPGENAVILGQGLGWALAWVPTSSWRFAQRSLSRAQAPGHCLGHSV